MKLLAITSSRADREPLTPVIKALGKHCVHLHIENGNIDSNFKINADAVILLGDQYHSLRNATEAANRGIPIIHLSGGDVTEGAVDDGFRHAITKLSYYHFPGCELHAQRIIKMGESPDRVFPLGFPAVDALEEAPMTRQECEKGLGLELKSSVALVAYNPETLGDDNPNNAKIAKLLIDYKTTVISGPNKDAGHDKIWHHVPNGNFSYKQTYPQRLWISLMHHADVLIGNSSGFIIEGMTMGKKFINIGDRQKGRYEDAVEMFKTQKFPFGVPGKVGKVIAQKILSLEIPKQPIKVLYEKANSI